MWNWVKERSDARIRSTPEEELIGKREEALKH